MEIINAGLTEQKKAFKNYKSQFLSNAKSKLIDQSIAPRDNQKLKIALVTETWSPEINGVAHSLLNLSKGLQSLGHQILLIRPKPKEKCQRFKANKECWVKAQAIPNYSSLQFGWPQFSKISKALDDFKPDVVHIVTEGPLGFASLLVARSKNIPVSSGYHSSFQEFSRYFEYPYLVKPIQRYLTWFHNKTKITCVPSVDTAASIRKMGVSCEIRTVGRGVDTQLFNLNKRSNQLRLKWGAQDTTKVLISVGRLSPEKEVDVVIQTYLKMKKNDQEDLKLVIVGDGPDRTRLEKMAESSDVLFTGSLVGEELAAAYASADVFIFPSQVETFGNVALEALASGLPVIGYDYACAKLHVTHDRTGWLVPLGDLTGLTDAVQAIPAQSILSKMGALAAAQVKETGWSKPSQDFEQALYFVAFELKLDA